MTRRLLTEARGRHNGALEEPKVRAVSHASIILAHVHMDYQHAFTGTHYSNTLVRRIVTSWKRTYIV
jgi:hypothetical protein